jgi:hypothetical protein
VRVTWSQPDYRGSVLTSYTITFRQADDLTFSESKATCDGTQETILTERTCLVPI